MTYPHGGAGEIWRDPATHNPKKSQIRDWGESVQNALDALQALAASGFNPVFDGPVDVATTGPIALNGEQTVDGVATSASRVLVKDQASASENGIYITAAGGWSRANDLNEASEFAQAGVFVLSGAANAGQTYVCKGAVAAVGTDPVIWVKFADQSGVQVQIDSINGRTAGVNSSVSGLPALLDMAGVELLGFDSHGRVVAKLSPRVLDAISGSSQMSATIAAALAASGFQSQQDVQNEITGKFPGVVQTASDLPAIIDQNGVELLGFDPASLDAVVRSLRVLGGRLHFQPFAKAPSIIDGNSIELLGFDGAGAARFKVSQDVADQVARLAQLPVAEQVLPSQELACFGDSMTAGAGGDGTSIRSVLASELGRTVYNGGVGGTTSASIAIRQGGRDFPITLDGGVIPSAVTEIDITDYGGAQAYNNQTSSTRTGTLAGVRGTLKRYGVSGNEGQAQKFTFTRAAGGDQVAVPAGTPFIFDEAIENREKTQIIWSGRNNAKSGRDDFVAIRDDVLSMAGFISVSHKRFLVVSICNGGENEGSGTGAYGGIAEANRELQEYFGANFVDLRSYMVHRAIYDAGITPTAQDLADMAADGIPDSLRNDAVHFNSDGYTQAGKFLARQITARGW